MPEPAIAIPSPRTAPLRTNRLIRRLLSRASFDGDCLVWGGARFKTGYGAIGIGQRVCYCHRLAFELFVGRIPRGLCVLHRCDNPPCLNPDHLFLGTRGDNHTDARAKGRLRWVRGEQNGRSKITSAVVRKIRRLYRKGVRGRGAPAVALRFGLNTSWVTRIVKREVWRHV